MVAAHLPGIELDRPASMSGSRITRSPFDCRSIGIADARALLLQPDAVDHALVPLRQVPLGRQRARCSASSPQVSPGRTSAFIRSSQSSDGPVGVALRGLRAASHARNVRETQKKSPRSRPCRCRRRPGRPARSRGPSPRPATGSCSGPSTPCSWRGTRPPARSIVSASAASRSRARGPPGRSPPRTPRSMSIDHRPVGSEQADLLGRLDLAGLLRRPAPSRRTRTPASVQRQEPGRPEAVDGRRASPVDAELADRRHDLARPHPRLGHRIVEELPRVHRANVQRRPAASDASSSRARTGSGALPRARPRTGRTCSSRTAASPRRRSRTGCSARCRAAGPPGRARASLPAAARAARRAERARSTSSIVTVSTAASVGGRPGACEPAGEPQVTSRARPRPTARSSRRHATNCTATPMPRPFSASIRGRPGGTEVAMPRELGDEHPGGPPDQRADHRDQEESRHRPGHAGQQHPPGHAGRRGSTTAHPRRRRDADDRDHARSRPRPPSPTVPGARPAPRSPRPRRSAAARAGSARRRRSVRPTSPVPISDLDARSPAHHDRSRAPTPLASSACRRSGSAHERARNRSPSAIPRAIEARTRRRRVVVRGGRPRAPPVQPRQDLLARRGLHEGRPDRLLLQRRPT